MNMGCRIIVPRAPIADIIKASDDLADIYSMFRLRRGYRGYCRRVLRTSDNAEIDIGFTAGGLYDIRKEQAWAAGSTTRVLRWYNQASGAGTGNHPEYMFKSSGGYSPIGLDAGTPLTFKGYPAIYLPHVDQSTMAPADGATTYEGYMSMVWIGNASIGSSASQLCQINADGFSTSASAYLNHYAPGTLYDHGPFSGDAATLTHPDGTWGNPSIYIASYELGGAYAHTANVNGSNRSVTPPSGRITVNPGTAKIGGKQYIHTIINSGDDELAIHGLAQSSFNAKNWIY